MGIIYTEEIVPWKTHYFIKIILEKAKQVFWKNYVVLKKMEYLQLSLEEMRSELTRAAPTFRKLNRSNAIYKVDFPQTPCVGNAGTKRWIIFRVGTLKYKVTSELAS